MPYVLRNSCVINSDTGETVKCHPSRSAARRHLRALYANVPDAKAVGITTKPMTRSEAARVAALARWGKYRPSSQVARGVQLSRQQARAAGQRAATPRPSARRGGGKKGGGGKGGGKGTDPAQQARQEQRDRERAEDRATRAADREARIARQQERDRERQQRATEGAAEKLRKELEKRAREQQKRGGGGGGGGKDKKDEQAARDAQRRIERAAAVAERRADARRRASEQERRERSRLEERNRRTQQTEQARQRQEQQRAADRQQQAIQRATAAQQREAQRRQEQTERSRVTTPELASAAQRLSAGEGVSATEQDGLIRNGLARRDREGNLILTSTGLRATKQKDAGSFTVFKDASGRYRWLTVTTTAFQDRDREIISTKALEADAARADADGQYGPLRWWHVGQPDPFNTSAPWGPGVDLGWCDFNAVSDSGLSLIESGTFLNEEIARTIAEKAADYEVSPGFFHPMGQPSPDGVYHTIRRFERSLVPRWAGRASNLFTALAVQETTMDDRKRAALKEAGFSDQQISSFLSSVETKEQSAAQQGIAYKSDDGAPQIYLLPDGTPGVIQAGAFVALKAAAPPTLPEPEEKDDGEGDMEMMAEGADDAMGGALFSPDELQEITSAVAPAVAAAVVEQLSPMLNMETKMGKLLDEFKGMYATKDDSRAAEIASLKEQQQQLSARLKELEGDQPLVTAPAEVEAALKSAGPQAPADPNAPQVPNDPTRPMAPIAARLMPELYKDDVWGPNGWPVAGGS